MFGGRVRRVRTKVRTPVGRRILTWWMRSPECAPCASLRACSSLTIPGGGTRFTTLVCAFNGQKKWHFDHDHDYEAAAYYLGTACVIQEDDMADELQMREADACLTALHKKANRGAKFHNVTT